MSRTLRKLVFVAAIVAAFAAMQGGALAAPPDGPVGPNDGAFLCPAVGDGVMNADGHNGDNGVSVIGPLPGSGSYSFLPGNNQAGAQSNVNAHNTDGPGTSPGPGGGNSDWSPIWPAG
ncbi:MAG: hypothetical protein ACR2N7_11220 [Acidimicrobiia bacterium]